ncbi:DNA repair protein RadC [Sphingobium xenophagum]|uniref:DNA repair protein RadC n=1 Tax=Sphingobium xenophagum TaxID=121428 RepID=A0A401J348_SPHXE|nr:DNA repair protein RadC [Sphingobium xenophagum]
MAWTDIVRQEHSRKGMRYSSSMTDRECELAARPVLASWQAPLDYLRADMAFLGWSGCGCCA